MGLRPDSEVVLIGSVKGGSRDFQILIQPSLGSWSFVNSSNGFGGDLNLNNKFIIKLASAGFEILAIGA